jgi:hypothetical protein
MFPGRWQLVVVLSRTRTSELSVGCHGADVKIYGETDMVDPSAARISKLFCGSVGAMRTSLDGAGVSLGWAAIGFRLMVFSQLQLLELVAPIVHVSADVYMEASCIKAGRK